jgi:hypothetical protein
MQMLVYPIRLNDPCLKIAQAVAELSMPWLLDAPGYLYSSALIFPVKRLDLRTQGQLQELGAIEAERHEIEVRPTINGVVQGQEIAQIEDIKRDYEYVCIRSFQRVISNQYRIEAYVAGGCIK